MTLDNWHIYGCLRPRQKSADYQNFGWYKKRKLHGKPNKTYRIRSRLTKISPVSSKGNFQETITNKLNTSMDHILYPWKWKNTCKNQWRRNKWIYLIIVTRQSSPINANWATPHIFLCEPHPQQFHFLQNTLLFLNSNKISFL